MSRILSQRLASGLGTGDLPWIKGSRTAFGEIVRETWAVKPLLLRRSPGRILKSSLPHDDSSPARQEITVQRNRIFAWAKLSVWALGPTRSCCMRGSHLPRNLCSSARQLSLDRSVRQSQNSGCLKDRETHQDTQLKCSAQNRRQPHDAFLQARNEFHIATLFFRAGARVRESLPKEVFFLSSRLLIQRQMNLSGPLAQFHQRTVADNGGQPGSHLRLPPKLVDMSVSGQERFLHCVLRVSCVTEKSKGAPIKRRQS
jgi:hypothetical protein